MSTDTPLLHESALIATVHTRLLRSCLSNTFNIAPGDKDWMSPDARAKLGV